MFVKIVRKIREMVLFIMKKCLIFIDGLGSFYVFM